MKLVSLFLIANTALAGGGGYESHGGSGLCSLLGGLCVLAAVVASPIGLYLLVVDTGVHLGLMNPPTWHEKHPDYKSPAH